MKLFHKLILGFLFVALLSLITGYFTIRFSKDLLQKAYIKNVEFLAVQILDGIEKDLQNKIEIFQKHSINSLPQKSILQSNHDFEKLTDLQSYINKREIEWISSPKGHLTPFMKDLINNDLSKDLRKTVKFYEKKHGYRVFPEVFITNKYGANIGLTGKTTDYRQDDELWWQSARKKGLYVGDAAFDESANVYSTDLGLRIDDEDGKFIGIIKIVVNIEGIFDLIKELESTGIHKEHRSMKYSIITNNGKLIYSSEGIEFFKDVSHLLPEHMKSYPENKSIKVGTFNSNVITKDKTLLTHVYSNGFRNFNLKWILLVEQETAELFSPVNKLRDSILTIALLITLLGLLIGFIISDSVLKNFKILSDAVVRIGSGDLDTTIEVKSNDEIGQLAKTFSQMTKNLKTTTVKRDELAAEIGKRKEVENELIRHRENLLVLVKERTYDLQLINEELEQEIAERIKAESEAVRANQLASLGEMAAGVAHEINNPINGIINYAQILFNKNPEGSKERDIAYRLIKEGNRIATIVNSLLLFARDSKEKKHPVKIYSIISDSLSLIEAQLKKTILASG